MALTEEDIRKIEAVVNARADLQDSKLEQAVAGLRSTMATKADLRATEARLTAKIESVKQIHKEFLESLDRAEDDVKAGRVKKLRSLEDLRSEA